MSWTALRVVEEGVVLYDGHARRLALAGDEALRRFQAFARDAAPGCYTIRAKDDGLEIESLPGSRLVDGMPARFAVSPYADEPGPFEKPMRPNRYADVRVGGFATLLTSPDGREIWESCSAIVLGWDGAQVVLAPEDRPRVRSTAEACIASLPGVRRAPLATDDAMPLALANAVGGVCRISVDARPTFPSEVLARLDAALRATARRETSTRR